MEIVLFSLLTLLIGFSRGLLYNKVFFIPKRKSIAISLVQENLKDKEPVKETQKAIIELYNLADSIDSYFKQSAHTKDLLESDDFNRGVSMLCSTEFSDAILLQYMTGVNILISCMAIEALRIRSVDETVLEQVLSYIRNAYIWPIYFALRLIAEKATFPVIGKVLVQTQEWWKDDGTTHTDHQCVHPGVDRRRGGAFIRCCSY